MIEKDKVIQYFSWFKKHNHLYKDFDIDPNLIEEFKDNTKETVMIFEENTKSRSNEVQINCPEEPSDMELSDDEEDFFQRYDIDVHEPPANERKQDYTSMFFNKYCENTDLPTVANRFADVVVEYETNKKIQIDE